MQQSVQTLRQVNLVDEIVSFFNNKGIDTSKYVVNGEIDIEKLVESMRDMNSSSDMEFKQILNFFNKKRATLQK